VRQVVAPVRAIRLSTRGVGGDGNEQHSLYRSTEQRATLLAGCHPGRRIEGEEGFLEFWEEVRGALRVMEKSTSHKLVT
jgi:hypothetical protein